MNLGLRSWSMLTIASVVMLVVASLSVLLMWQFHNSTDHIRHLSSQSLTTRLVDQMRDYGTQLGKQGAKDLAAPLAELDFQQLRGQLQRLREQPNVAYAQLYDHDGLLIADGSTTIDGYGEALAAADGGLTDATHRVLANTLEIDLPVRHFERQLGGVRIGLSLGPIYAQAADVNQQLDAVIDEGKALNWRHVATTTGLFLAFAVALALLVARNLVTPIQRLATYASAVGIGNYKSPLPIERSDELGDLARSLKEMSENLQVTTGEVHYLAYHDSLTRLPNRAQLKQSLRQAIARGERTGDSVALLFIDLDDFKRVNDTLGHEAGDTLLKEFALRLRHCLRSGDELESQKDHEPRETIARLGGDEFTVVLNSVREGADAGVVASRILSVLKDPFVLGGQEVVIGASIGITTFPEDGVDVDTLLRNADVAMYQAKERGKNHFEFYNDSMHRMATERLSLETDLRHAIEYEQIRVLYQPILDAKTRRLVAIEAQLRWIHPALGSILPSVFVPLAEQTGYIVELDEWLIERTCADIAALNELGQDAFSMFATLSSVHFRNQAIAPTLVEAINRNNLQPGRLALAIGEKTLMRNFPRASALLEELRERGVHVWVDGFGGGHSPLSYLPRMPVQGLKIDSEFVGAIAGGENERAIVSTLIAMAHSLNLKVMAADVENTDQIAILRDVGCDYAQGSLFVRPMLLADLVTWLEQQAHSRDRASQTGTFASIPFVKPKNMS